MNTIAHLSPKAMLIYILVTILNRQHRSFERRDILLDLLCRCPASIFDVLKYGSPMCPVLYSILRALSMTSASRSTKFGKEPMCGVCSGEKKCPPHCPHLHIPSLWIVLKTTFYAHRRMIMTMPNNLVRDFCAMRFLLPACGV